MFFQKLHTLLFHENQVTNPQIRDAIYLNRVRLEKRMVAGFLIIGLILLITLAIENWFIVIYQPGTANEQLANLKQTTTQLTIDVAESKTTLAEQALLSANLQSQINDSRQLPASQIVNSTPATGSTQKYDLKVKLGATRSGYGDFYLRLEGVPNPQGTFTAEGLEQYIDRLIYIGDANLIAICGMYDRGFEHYSLSPKIGRVILSNDDDKTMPEACWSRLEGIAGTKIDPDGKVPVSVVEHLKNYASTGNQERNIISWLVFIDESQRRILGYWNGPNKDPQASCVKTALRQVGWDGGNYFTIDPYQDSVWDILYVNALTNQWGEAIPDFCESANLKPVEKPAWVGYSKIGDSHLINFQRGNNSFQARLRTYPDVWDKNQILVEIMNGAFGKPWVTIQPHDLILLDRGFGDIGSMVYLTLDENKKPLWYVPSGEGPEYTSFQRVPAVWFNPSIDNIGPFFALGGASAYIVDRQPFTQTVAVEFTGIAPVAPLPEVAMPKLPTPEIPVVKNDPPVPMAITLSGENAENYDLMRFKVRELEVKDKHLHIGVGGGSIPIATCEDADLQRLADVLNKHDSNEEIQIWVWRGFIYEIPHEWMICSAWPPDGLFEELEAK